MKRSKSGEVVLGDTIVAIQGKAVPTVPALHARLDDFKVGDNVTLTVLRDGKTLELNATLQPEG